MVMRVWSSLKERRTPAAVAHGEPMEMEAGLKSLAFHGHASLETRGPFGGAHTALGIDGLAKRLQMGHDKFANRLTRRGGEHSEVRKCLRSRGRM